MSISPVRRLFAVVSVVNLFYPLVMAIAHQDVTHRDEMTNPVNSVKERFKAVSDRVAAAAKRAGTNPNQVVIVAVTKYASIDQVREMIDLGHIDFGEAYVQNLVQRAAQIDEYLQRRRQLGDRNSNVPEKVRWHMVGHLQRNKAKKVVNLIRLIHSVDSLRLAEEVQAAANRQEEPIEVLVQANVSGEKSKHGVQPAATRHLIEQIDNMVNLKVRGLMCMAPLADDPEESRPVFERCKELFDDICKEGSGGDRFDILSMGMTNDFEAAIECGANLVRIGTAIFGERSENETTEED